MTRPLVLALLALALLAGPAAAQQQPPPSIDVRGEATVTAANDAARIGVLARRRAASAAAALDRASALARGIIAAVRQTGVLAEDVTTGSVTVTRTRRRPGFVAVQRIRVVQRTASRAGETVAAAVRAGGLDVSGPEFFVRDPRALYRRALLLAFDDAREKARALAERAGVTLGRPLRIVEQGVAIDAVAAAGGGSSEPPPPTRPGRSVVEATLEVSFASG